MPPSVLARLRKRCLAFPEAHEVVSWNAPTFRVKNKLFAMYADKADHHGYGRNGVWVKMKAENQQLMLRDAPDRFFFPPYVGPSGWLGVYLDAKTDWKELDTLLEDAWRATAPKSLVKKFKTP